MHKPKKEDLKIIRENVWGKAIALSIVAIFIGSAIVPAVDSQWENTVGSQLLGESDNIKIGVEKSVNKMDTINSRYLEEDASIDEINYINNRLLNLSNLYRFVSLFRGNLLLDSEFNDSSNSSDLRANDPGQDWYESRDDDPTLLTLDVSDIAGNMGKKAALKGYGSSPTAYLDQNFSSIQSGMFNVSFDIYIENISDYSNYDRTGFIFIGDDNSGGGVPCSTSVERFVFLVFYDSTPGETGDDLEIRARTLSSQSWGTTSAWTSVATDLSYDTWYTIRLEVDFANSCYDIYMDDMLIGDNIPGYSGYASSSVNDISFSVGGTARGDYYLDNVFAPALDRHKLSIDVVGNGSVVVDPGESTYANGTVVELNATADPGWLILANLRMRMAQLLSLMLLLILVGHLLVGVVI